MTATVTPAPVEPPRDGKGRYLLPIPGSSRIDQATGQPIPGTLERKPHTRVTNIAKLVRDSYNLEQWGLRMAVKGVGLRADLHMAAAAADIDDKRTLNDIAKQAKDAAAASKGANIGTALHSFTEQVDRGLPVAPPPPYDADVDAYRATMAAHGLTVHPWWIERVLYHPELLIAGTTDRLLMAPGWDRPRIGDLKTGGFLSYDEIALQLALYAYAPCWYDAATDTFGFTADTGVDREKAVVIHLPQGTGSCTVYEVDIAAGWEAVQLALAVRDWRRRRDIARPLGGAA
jgi:hypothetical protein